MRNLGNAEIAAAGLDDWRKLSQALHARFRAADLTTGAAFVVAVAEVASGSRPHPRVTLANGVVDIALSTHQDGRWVTDDDVAVARSISDIARRHGLAAEPAELTHLDIALDTAHQERVGRFWSALLTGSPDHLVGDTVFDPSDRVPPVWFQPTTDRPQAAQRWHHDVWVAPEAAAPRIAAALRAGGFLVSDAHAPAWTVLADPDGNRVCVCTSEGRG